MLEKEFQYYIDNQKSLVEKFSGKYLIIKDEAVKGDFSTREEALSEAKKKFQTGTFLIQLCSPGDAAYSQTFHSRVVYHKV